MPNAIATPTSNMLLLALYAPMVQHKTIIGYSRRYGTLSSLTHRPISGRLRITSMTLPIHMDAIRPQNSSGVLVMICGPGWMSWMISAPTISAITALDGMPSVSIGMNEVWAPALLAASGPATPSIAPLPKRDGSEDIFFSTV